jgi:hypothetical protein
MKKPMDKLDHPYVTWVMNDRGHCFSGNYFLDIVAAAKDYGERN